MSTSVYSEINFHITWHTKGNLPMIREKVEDRLYHYLTHKILDTPAPDFIDSGDRRPRPDCVRPSRGSCRAAVAVRGVARPRNRVRYLALAALGAYLSHYRWYQHAAESQAPLRDVSGQRSA